MAKSVTEAGPDISARLARIGTAAQRARPKTLLKAMRAAEIEQARRIRRDSGGDMRLSGVNRAKGRPGNVRVGARSRLTSDSTGIVTATGPLQLINNDTRGRVIRSAYLRGRGRRGFVGPEAPGQFRGDRRAVLNIPGIGFRRSARHPGTRGKNTWQEGRKTAIPKATKQMRTNTRQVIVEAM